MTQTKKSPVNPQVNNLPQPHVNIPDRKSENCQCWGWFAFVSVGACAILFIILVIAFGEGNLFPIAVNLYAGLVPIVKKGYLQVLPFAVETKSGNQDSFFVKLPLKKAEQIEFVRVLDQLLKGYPEKHEEPYRNCWLENPSKDHPCFFDRSWLTEICSKNNSYGYDMFRGEYSPCFILKFVNTSDWKPIPPFYESLKGSTLGYAFEHVDHGFIPVVCIAQDETRTSTSIGVDIYPPKGFALLYFPQSNFGSAYLPPLLAVKVSGMPRGRNVTIDCSIVALNAFVLGNNGKFSITFSTS